METNTGPIESLLQHAEQYNKVSLELLKLKSIDKTADVASTVFSRFAQVIALSLFALTLTIAVSFWLGELLGKTYYGFLVVSSLYAVVGIILFLCHPIIKARIANSIIMQMLH
jgi:hypothetical protein